MLGNEGPFQGVSLMAPDRFLLETHTRVADTRVAEDAYPSQGPASKPTGPFPLSRVNNQGRLVTMGFVGGRSLLEGNVDDDWRRTQPATALLPFLDQA